MGVTSHILVDTLGLFLNVAVHRADIQDRDGTALVRGALVLGKATRALFPFIQGMLRRLPGNKLSGQTLRVRRGLVVLRGPLAPASTASSRSDQPADLRRLTVDDAACSKIIWDRFSTMRS